MSTSRTVPEVYFRALVRLAWLSERYAALMADPDWRSERWDAACEGTLDGIDRALADLRSARAEVARLTRETHQGRSERSGGAEDRIGSSFDTPSIFP